MEMMAAKTAPLALTYAPHPLNAQGREVMVAEWMAGRTIREHLIAADIDLHREIVIYHNSRLLKVVEWDVLCPAPGDIINVESVVSGGDDGSNPIATILSIAVMVAAPHLAFAMFAEAGVSAAAFAATTFGMVTTAAVAIAGNLVVSALFRSSQSSSATASTATESPTYSLSGGSNSIRPYEPLPVVMGNHRVFPDYGAKPYTEYDGDDQYLYQVFNFGIGNLALSDLRIGETLLSSYSDVTVTRAENGVLPGFYGNVDSTEGAALTNDVGWVTRTSGLATTRLAVDLVGTFYYANDEGGLGARSAEFQIEYAVKDSGVWQPFIPQEYAPVDAYWSKGYWQSTWVEAYYDGEGVYHAAVESAPVWVQEGFDSNLSQSAHSNGADAGSITIVGSSGGEFENTYTVQPLIWRWVAVGVDPHPTSQYSSSTNTLTLSGASSKQQRKTVSRTVASGQYDVRARRVSADETDSKYQSSVEWSILRSYQDGVADYTDQTVLGIKIKASGQLSGSIAQLSALAVQSTWAWDGSVWILSATTNPVWWYLAMARGVRNAEGRLLYGCGLSDEQIDFDALKAWAVFCDANELSFSAVFDQSQTAADALNNIARCGFASPSRGSGKLGVVWDAPNQAPVMAFGMSNIIKGSFEVSYLADDLADEIVVQYTNRNNSWVSDQVRVTVPGTEGFPVRPSSVELMGCTTNAMAAKFANALAAQQLYRRRTITWETDFEGFVCQRGDVVILSHDLTQWGYSGRFVAVDGDTVTLSRSVPRSGAAEYLMIQYPDGDMVTVAVPAGSGESDTLTLPVGSFELQPGYAAIDHKWYFSPLATPGKKVKIMSVQPLSETRIRLIATDESPEYYAAWNGVFTAPTTQTLLGQNSVTVSNLTLKLHQLVVDDFQINRVVASWIQRGGVQSCVVRAWLDGSPINTWTGVTGASIEIDRPEQEGTLSIELTPVGEFGNGASVSASIELSTLPAPAAPVLTLSGGLFCVNSAWSFGDLRTDVRCTEIWFSSTNNRASAARITSEPYPGAQYSQIGMQPGAGGYYWARVVDTRGNASEWYPSGASEGLYCVASEDATSLLTQLQGQLGMPQLAAELAAPIALIPSILGDVSATAATVAGLVSDTAILPDMAQDILQRAIDIDGLAERARFEKAVTDATIDVDPVTGVIRLLATANVTTEVEARLTQVETELNAAEGALTSTVATVADLGDDLSSAQSQISQIADQVSLKASSAYVDDALADATGALTVEAANNAQALAETAIRQALGLDTATDKELVARARIAAAEFDIQATADDLQAESTARLALLAVVNEQQAALVNEQTVRSGVDAAESTARLALAARVTAAEGSVTAQAAQIADRYTKVQTDSAISVASETLQSSLGNSIASVQQTASATASAVGGLEAEWGVQTQTMADGVRATAGIKLLSGTDGESVFAVLAHKLLVYRPDGTGAPVQVITLGAVNGVTALGLDGNLIVDDSIVARHLSVDSLNAIAANVQGKLTAGEMSVGEAAISDASITNAKIANAAITNAKIGNAEVDTLKIAGNAVTIPVSASGAVSAATASVDFAGQAVCIMASASAMIVQGAALVGSAELRVKRDGVVIKTAVTCHYILGDSEGGTADTASASLSFVDYPGSGAHYYSVEHVAVNGPELRNASCGVLALGVKR